VLQDGTVIRGLRVRFENGKAVEVDADENAEALRAKPTSWELNQGSLRHQEVDDVSAGCSVQDANC
jgi:hypothetical protein